MLLQERQLNEQLKNAGSAQFNELTVHLVLSFLLFVLANEVCDYL